MAEARKPLAMMQVRLLSCLALHEPLRSVTWSFSRSRFYSINLHTRKNVLVLDCENPKKFQFTDKETLRSPGHVCVCMRVCTHSVVVYVYSLIHMHMRTRKIACAHINTYIHQPRVRSKACKHTRPGNRNKSPVSFYRHSQLTGHTSISGNPDFFIIPCYRPGISRVCILRD
jgi:hypothetical protein